MTAPLHRHQLARLAPAGWRRVAERPWDNGARACLAHWSKHGLPLVVTRQAGGDDATIAMGLPAPGRWGRRRIALGIPRGDVLYFDEFPSAPEIATLLPSVVRIDWLRLCAALRSCGCAARVYGSYGWQRISRLDHVRSDSDVDVVVTVTHPDQADAAAAALQAWAHARPRLDGELVFDGDSAVAWREWLAWRSGRARALLVKRLSGSALVEHAADSTRPAAVPEVQ